MSEEQFLEEIHAPGYKPSWAGDNFDPIFWGVHEEFEKSIGLIQSYRFRPRYAQALAMLRRKSGRFVHNNLPYWEPRLGGWQNFSYVLGPESEWEDPPDLDESMSAYLTVFHIHLTTGFGVVASLAGMTRVGSYAHAKTNLELDTLRRDWEQDWQTREDTLAFPYDLETHAILATSAVLAYEKMREYYGLRFASTHGPLIWGKPDKSVFQYWR
jgi:hypothetical protein